MQRLPFRRADPCAAGSPQPNVPLPAFQRYPDFSSPPQGKPYDIPGMASPEPKRILISDLISLATVQLQLRGRQRDEVLTELVARIPEIAERPEASQSLLRALQEREQLHSTGIGDGVALPHARNTLVGLVEKPVVVFGRHDQGIGYGALDGQPARLFFLLVTANVSQHLAILARISRLLRDPFLRQNLVSADRPEKVIGLIREAEAKL